ncbi:helix-turn-helix domain-containing protein [Streptomyces lunaelactis]|uniref:PucR family transcriptional regulator n=1 Tax=Streptomyces lunaelactis TaxID=1535768 RepID=UPI001584E522|nr:helix-turn-helix domain-containing protein [Streptomyces lunaelactis]NUK34931.1 helix-turn-helix domain-containing protein [Streptomyces lunaelactis]NUK41683.1 helix-turn-helix domain-containing protein [Streptomyces lunaelactis]NUK92047.1 helix-turn-helix domain-containing protein [Streptomyces lunaelactis]NUL29595.1 helix-turn-helix domain-containing protein [Streptomyces lunaelactis]
MHAISVPGSFRPRGHDVSLPSGPVPDGGADSSPLQLFDRACRRLLGHGEEFTDTVVERIRAEVPYYADPVLAPPDVRRTVGVGIRHGLEAGVDPSRIVDVERYTRDLGMRRAEQGRPLDEVLHAYRVAGSEVWSGIISVVERDGLGDARQLVHVAELVWKSNDRDAVMVADAYRQVAKGVASRHGERVRLILAALLETRNEPEFTRDAAAILDLPLDGRFAVAVVGATPPYGRAPQTTPEVRGIRILRHACGRRDVLVADLGDRPLDALASGLDAGPGFRIGISPVVQGLESLARARDMAGLALRTCRADGEIARLDSRLPEGLLISRPDLSAELAHGVLRPMYDLEPADRDTLFDTVSVWIENGGSAVQAARHMLCHRNTVLNRLRRFEQTTGLALTRPRDLVQLTLALDAHRLLGPTAALGTIDRNRLPTA